jgi:hypothetical protein
MCFWDKKLEKQTKIVAHMDLWKYGQILAIQKSLAIQWFKFSKKNNSMSLSSCATLYIKSQ